MQWSKVHLNASEFRTLFFMLPFIKILQQKMGATSQWIVIILKGYEAGTEVAPLGEGCGPLRIVFVDDILVEFEQVAVRLKNVTEWDD